MPSSMEPVYTYTLSNGIRVVHQPMAREVVHCGLLIGAGSRDEQKQEHGLAHFLEHCLFKGTSHRKTFHILSRLDAVGGELNAFTAKEETWIHASVLKHHLERAIELMADISFHATFPAREIEKEKAVILDEINSYLDSPADMVFEEYDQLFFGSHPLGRSILGSESSLGKFRQSHLRHFRTRIMHPDHLVFTCAGPADPKKLQYYLEKHFGVHRLERTPLRRRRHTPGPAVSRTVQKDIHQVHYVLGFPAYAYPDAKRPALTLISNILGGPGLNNRLSLNVREKYGFAYHIDATYAPFTDAGIFSVYLGTDRQHLRRSQALIWKELDAFRKKKLSDKTLREAKLQLSGQIALSQDNGNSTMFNLGKSLLLFDRIDTLEEVYARIDAITATEILEVANEIFDQNKMVELVYEPAG
jgi:predicted Zn-dependent peptidase